MTYDELKAEAKRQGYKLIKQTPYIRFESCVCGRKYPVLWFGHDSNFYKCPNCNKTAPGAQTEREARLNWNNYMKEVNHGSSQ